MVRPDATGMTSILWWLSFPMSSPVASSSDGPVCAGIGGWNTSFYNFPPFVDLRTGNATGAMYQVMVDMLSSCCSWKQGLPRSETRVENARTLEENHYSDVMFALPVTRNMYLAELYNLDNDHMYIPIIHTQGPMLVVNSDTNEDALTSSLIASFPLLLLVLISAGIAAIMIWLLDHHKNPGSFPKAFVQGFWEGIWWAYVTMTTVGYGDKTPRSIPGRLFGLVWITMGIVIMSVFTATLAATFTSVTTVSMDLRGMRIGVVNGSEEYIVSFSNGADTKVYENYKLLVDAAKDTQDIDGMLLDRFFVLYQATLLSSYGFVIVGAIHSPAVHGILVNSHNSALLSCFSGFIASHKFDIYDYIENTLQSSERRTSVQAARSILAPQAPTLYIAGGLLCAMFSLGVLYDLCRRFLKAKQIGRIFSRSTDPEHEPPDKPSDNTCVVSLDVYPT